MGIRLTEDEAWGRLASAHTGVLTTLRADGWPVALPTWFVVLDGHVYLRTPSRSKKVTRLRRDPRASFLIESGHHWVELTAVHLAVEAHVVEDAAEIGRAMAAITDKYAGLGPPMARVGKATADHYAGMIVIRLDPVGAPLSWDNSRVRLGDERPVPAGTGEPGAVCALT